ncbi:MAG: hypothetical protein KME36_01440 [Candidatus Thiodiazotropha sp. (ex Lucina pensylvanica)]|nr:hypothetical protein [Candidatus Thiodiazotropha sp. (ex Lucina pensylvanica)]MBT3050328.1 hypothetical protein [Candidatus Thiodiazotropha sp. (ex Codakia orbicularis)]
MDIKLSINMANLSEASYADFRAAEQPDGSYRSSDVQTALINIGGENNEDKGFSLTQAADFVTHWRVAHHLPNTSTGFSATIFESLDNPGEYVFAMRGTEPTAQWGTDITLTDIADIGADGIALYQAVDLVNYYQKLITPAGGLAPQYEVYEGTLIPPEGTDYVVTGLQYRYLRAIDRVQGLGVIPYNSGPIDVTGHSLGGHLALIMSRLDPNRVGEVYTYNAPAFDTDIIGSDDTEWFFRAMAQIETNETGMTTVGGFPVTHVNNYVVPEDVISDIGTLPGGTIQHFSEINNTTPVHIAVSSHSISNVSNALAIYNILAALDPNASLPSLTSILDAASNQGEESLEKVVYSLSELLINPIDVPIDEREPLYQAIQTIETEIFIDRIVANPQLKPIYQNLAVESLAELTQDQIVAQANSDIGYRYALTHLNPFAITGRESIYDDHNENGELELYNQITQAGEITQNYLADRAAFLATLNAFNRTNESIVGNNLIEFQDWDNGSVRLSAMITATGDNLSQHVFFGDKQRDTLAGGADEDRLYGGGGNDTLTGNAGNDYLEGNAGGLFGGVGDDALYCDNRYFDEVTNRYVLEGDGASIHFNGNLCMCTLQYPGNSL